MDEQDRPTVVRLLFYMIVAAGLAGGIAGWIGSSGALEWMAGLELPSWKPQFTVTIVVWSVLLQLTAIGLWISQRSGRDGLRFISTFLIIGLIAVLCARVCIYFGSRDVMIGFLASLASWIYALFAVGIAGRCSKATGFLMWPLFAWLTYGLALSFEIMRLNAGNTQFVGGL